MISGVSLIFVHFSSFLILSATNYSELSLVELDLANDRNELSGFPRLSILQLRLIVHLKEHQIAPAPVMYDPVEAIGHRINEVNRKGMAPPVFILFYFFTLNPSSALEIKTSPPRSPGPRKLQQRKLGSMRRHSPPTLQLYDLSFFSVSLKQHIPLDLSLSGSEILNQEESIPCWVRSPLL